MSGLLFVAGLWFLKSAASALLINERAFEGFSQAHRRLFLLHLLASAASFMLCGLALWLLRPGKTEALP